MLTSIQFDNKFIFDGDKVNNEITYGMLTSKIYPRFNLSPRKYAHNFLSAGVGSLRNFPALCIVFGFERLAGITAL